MATLPGEAVLRPVTYPSELAGKSNGNLPTTILSTISYPGGGTGIFCKTAARAFRAMLDAMGKAGFKMMTVGGYRSYQQQVTLFTSRYYRVNYNSGIWWDKSYWVKRAGVAVAAIPGTSNHGWGLADDMAENLDSDPSAEGISQRAVDWLVRNADRYGISAELRSEAWHWRYYKGDNIPQAVLDFENGDDEVLTTKQDVRLVNTSEFVGAFMQARAKATNLRRDDGTPSADVDLNLIYNKIADTVIKKLVEGGYVLPPGSSGITEDEAKALIAGSKIVP